MASLTGLAEFGYTPEKKKVCIKLIKLPFLKVGYHTGNLIKCAASSFKAYKLLVGTCDLRTL